MKHLLLTLILTTATSAFATTNYVPVPDGSYSGCGTWTDNFGANGTWQLTDTVSNRGGHHDFSAQFSDGRQYAGSVDVQFSINSNYTFIANVGGQSVTVGQGISSPNSYQNSLALSAVETITEFGQFASCGNWSRSGSIVDSQSGRATFVTITLTASGDSVSPSSQLPL